MSKAKADAKSLKSKVTESSKSREDTDERDELLEDYQRLEEQNHRLKSRLAEMKELDPEEHGKKKKALSEAKMAVERNTGMSCGHRRSLPMSVVTVGGDVDSNVMMAFAQTTSSR